MKSTLETQLFPESDLPTSQAHTADNDSDDAILPAYIIIKSNGLTRFYQPESTEWSNIESELASNIGAMRLEVVRYTAPLNELTRRIGLRGEHLIFMVDKYGYARPEVGDNMPGTILYGSGYEIMGDIIIALESDEGYNISGVKSYNLLTQKMIFAINDAVGGLLTLE